MPRLNLIPSLALLVACSQAGNAQGGNETAGNGQLAASATEPYPGIAVLDAFRAACLGAESQDTLRAAAVTNGWTPVTDPSTTPLRQVMTAVGEASRAMLEMNPGATNDDVLLSRVVAGETLYLQMAQTTIGGHTAGECRLYDPGETRTIPTDVVTRWLGRTPVETVSEAGVIRDRWSPALDGRGGRFGVTLLGEGSRLAQAAQFSGLMITNDRTPTSR